MIRFKSVFVFFAIIMCVMVSNIEANSIIPPQVLDGHYIIIMRNEQGITADLNAKVSECGGQIVRTIPEIGVATAISEDDTFTDKLAKYNDILCVIPDLRIELGPNEINAQGITPYDEPYFDFYQWNMKAIYAPKAWEKGYTGKGARVAVLDSGITANHPDLSGNIDSSKCFSFIPETLPDNKWYEDIAGHGTHVAGIIAALDNGIGVIGVAPEATIIAVKVLTYLYGWGAGGDLSWIIAGIVYAATSADADIINMSLSAYFPKNGHYPEGWDPKLTQLYASYLSLFNRTCNFANQQGVTLISGAGNSQLNLTFDKEWINLPAEVETCLAVSATGPLSGQYPDTPAFYTNIGISVIDIAAPGGNIDLSVYPYMLQDMVLSTWPTGWAWNCGASMAASHVTGLAALIISKHGGNISTAQVKQIIKQSADDLGKPGVDHYYGSGRINAYKAVAIE